MNVGKFEWDMSDGEIRYSYCFTTENGVGYEAFSAIIATITQTGDKLWPESEDPDGRVTTLVAGARRDLMLSLALRPGRKAAEA